MQLKMIESPEGARFNPVVNIEVAVARVGEDSVEMGAYRELCYGAMFLISACCGAAIAGWFGYYIGGMDIDELALESAVWATPYGAALGRLTWLAFRYTYLKSPRF